MGKARPTKKSSTKKVVKHRRVEENPTKLFQKGAALLETGQPEEAFGFVKRALDALPENSPSALLGLCTLGEILLELGDIDRAREAFERAVALDPNGEVSDEEGGGADKFLMLAELSPEGGEDSVRWYEKGVATLRQRIQKAESSGNEEDRQALEEYRLKLSAALCSVVEIYMTDLSFNDDAETQCENLVTEAVMIAPDSAEALQTLANVRISQVRFDDARAALSRSLSLWTDLSPDDPKVPAFPVRVSLVRLLMEVQMEPQAMDVIERMILEDDQSVETWYLGGWCLHLIGKGHELHPDIHPEMDPKIRFATLRSSVRWLRQSLSLYDKLEYEDERLRDHARELIVELETEIGPVPEEETEEEMVPDAGGEEDASEDEDDEMQDH